VLNGIGVAPLERTHYVRGGQYCAYDYQNLLQQFGMIASMSRKGDCYDNAPMESFWGDT
jgi:putative transposase